jgi:hypothetical protein
MVSILHTESNLWSTQIPWGSAHIGRRYGAVTAVRRNPVALHLALFI